MVKKIDKKFCDMKKNFLIAALAALTALAGVASCGGGDYTSKVPGKYELVGMDSECDFSADGKYTVTITTPELGYTSITPGEWKVDGDSIYITTYLTETTCNFNSDVSEEDKASFENDMKALAEEMPVQKRALKIVKVNGGGMTLEFNGFEQEYKRLD